MGSNRRSNLFGRLWQVPLLVGSLGLFGYAAYKVIDPKPPPTPAQKLAWARQLIEQNRPEAALAWLNQCLNDKTMKPLEQAELHLGLAESIEAIQQNKQIDLPANHKQIINQIRLAQQLGATLDAGAHLRLARSSEAVDETGHALECYQAAIALEPTLEPGLLRRVIELQLRRDDSEATRASLSKFLARPDLAEEEKVWAMGHQARYAIEHGDTKEAAQLLRQASELAKDEMAKGELSYWSGTVALREGDTAAAEEHFLEARKLLKGRHVRDADAAYELGKMATARRDFDGAIVQFNDVLVAHPGAVITPLARLARGVARIRKNEFEAALTDLDDAVAVILRKASLTRIRGQAIGLLQDASAAMSEQGNIPGAIEALALEQSLTPKPDGEFFARLGAAYEKRGTELEAKGAGEAIAKSTAKRVNSGSDAFKRAGDAYFAYSRKIVLSDDLGSGEALWHAADLYERAADAQSVIRTLDTFINERPDDRRAPDATLRLGRAYHAGGNFEKAISTLQRIAFRYPKSLAASKSAVPLAQAHISSGPAGYAAAERVLLSVVEDNPLLTPAAAEFKGALWELAQLYYRTQRYEQAIARLDEINKRYPQDGNEARLLFLMADSYRKSAELIAKPTTQPVEEGDRAIREQARRDRLTEAESLFGRVIDAYRARPPVRDLDKLQYKLAHFYRADCAFDLGNLAGAIKSYETAASRFKEDPAALNAYVQIVNANLALGNTKEAKAANERARLLLRYMPAEAFGQQDTNLGKDAWKQWLDWSAQAGIW